MVCIRVKFLLSTPSDSTSLDGFQCVVQTLSRCTEVSRVGDRSSRCVDRLHIFDSVSVMQRLEYYVNLYI